MSLQPHSLQHHSEVDRPRFVTNVTSLQPHSEVDRPRFVTDVTSLQLLVTTKIIEESLPVTDKFFLDLLSTVFGFPDIKTVEKYARSLGSPGEWIEESEDDARGIDALKVILETEPEILVEHAAVCKDYVVLSTLLERHPDLISETLSYEVDLSVVVDAAKSIDYRFSYEDLDTILDNLSNNFLYKDSEAEWIINNCDFLIDDISAVVELLLTLNRSGSNHRRIYEKLVREVLVDKDVKEHIQQSLNENLFVLSSDNLPNDDYMWYNCASRYLLEVLGENGISTRPFSTSVTVNSHILAAYVEPEDEEIRQLLMREYNARPSYVSVAQAVLKNNYELASKWIGEIEWTGNDIAMIISRLMTKGDCSKVEWLIHQFILPPETLTHFYHVIIDMALGAPLPEPQDEFILDVFKITQRHSLDIPEWLKSVVSMSGPELAYYITNLGDVDDIDRWKITYLMNN